MPFLAKIKKQIVLIQQGWRQVLFDRTINDVIRRLRATRGMGEFSLFKQGNPVSSTIISRYLQVIQLEQSFAHLPIKQAKPVFLDKSRNICDHINRKLNTTN